MTDTKSKDPSWTQPTVGEKFLLGKPLDSSSYMQSSPGQPSDGDGQTHFVCPFMEEHARHSTAIGAVRIVSVHRKGKFVRVFNSLLNKEVDLTGYIIQQQIGGYPVSIYRFPNDTILPAQHHITVWAAGANLAHEESSDMLPGPHFFKAGPDCVTLLFDHSGQIVSQHTTPHRFTAAAEAFSDNVDLSVDKFPLNDDEELFESLPPKPELAVSQRTRNKNVESHSGILVKRRFTRHFSTDILPASKHWNGRTIGIKSTTSDAATANSVLHSWSSKTLPPPFAIRESHSSSSGEDSFAFRSWQPLLKEPEIREFKTTLDTTLPMVSLIGQKSARSKYGFKYMTYMPMTTDLHLRRYCHAR